MIRCDSWAVVQFATSVVARLAYRLAYVVASASVALVITPSSTDGRLAESAFVVGT